MSVFLETTEGDLVIDLFSEESPKGCLNFLKLCKIKYYNQCIFHFVHNGFIIQTGDPTNTGKGGSSVWGVIEGEKKRYFEDHFSPKLKHNKRGIVTMVNKGPNQNGSQFAITVRGTDLEHLDNKNMIIGIVEEGIDIVENISEAVTDEKGRPYENIRILNTEILEDPFDDPDGLVIPKVQEETEIKKESGRLEKEEIIQLTEKKVTVEEKEKESIKSNSDLLTILGDLPDSNITPPENVLFVCKLNPITEDEDLEIIFSRYGKVLSCEIVRERETNSSLGYAFIEYEKKEQAERAYVKLNNVLIDDRRIKVDFSQSVSKQIYQNNRKRMFQQSQVIESKNGGKLISLGVHNLNPFMQQQKKPQQQLQKKKKTNDKFVLKKSAKVWSSGTNFVFGMESVNVPQVKEIISESKTKTKHRHKHRHKHKHKHKHPHKRKHKHSHTKEKEKN
ncbi:peptidyl-prolyl cis-trans isomerase-like 4 [Anaeramoeba flamelloides]|uniref:Peptidyl-prolyl cis-trans isomerase n=1 Tax=Anaeramoeba flamelloides TaxID=1746091 RepID=A0ABQ8YLS4_9EUKA|nr:peptidyl-prolyl cis-trans isomerase-like 4 [Anaeramoeba flamelloides]